MRVPPRIPETDHGIQGEFNVMTYNTLMKNLRDKNRLATPLILQAGIRTGSALEVGPGPGYLGLEWLKKTQNTRLTGLDISPDMIALAEKNAREYGLAERVEYVKSDSQQMPFDDQTFDAVFTNGSLHEWANPTATFNEIERVLKPGGKYCISDLRRDMQPLIKFLMKAMTKPKAIKPGLISSIRAAYTKNELEKMLPNTRLKNYEIQQHVVGLAIYGKK